jgi:hypothetical protein
MRLLGTRFASRRRPAVRRPLFFAEGRRARARIRGAGAGHRRRRRGKPVCCACIVIPGEESPSHACPSPLGTRCHLCADGCPPENPLTCVASAGGRGRGRIPLKMDALNHAFAGAHHVPQGAHGQRGIDSRHPAGCGKEVVVWRRREAPGATCSLTMRAPTAAEIGNFYYGPGHPMKPHRKSSRSAAPPCFRSRSRCRPRAPCHVRQASHRRGEIRRTMLA